MTAKNSRSLANSALLCLLVLVACTLTLAAQKTTAYYTITATMYNFDASNNPFTLQSDGTTSAVYNPNTDSTILGYLYPSPSRSCCATIYYEWDADLSQSSRSFLLTLKPLDGTSPDLFNGGTVAFNGQFRSRCFDPANNVFNWTTIQTSDTNCAMRVNFTYQNTNYTLVMSPLEAGTGTATVTCTNWNGTICSAWTDVPTAGIVNANVAHLYSSTKKGSQYVGAYALTFSMSMTHP